MRRDRFAAILVHIREVIHRSEHPPGRRSGGTFIKREHVPRPLKLWLPVLPFLVPALPSVVAQYVLWPYPVRFGRSEKNAYNGGHFPHVTAGVYCLPGSIVLHL